MYRTTREHSPGDEVGQCMKPCRPYHLQPLLTETLQHIRKERERSRITTLLMEEFGPVSLSTRMTINKSIDFGGFVQRLVLPQEPDMEDFAASEALDCLDAYYKVRSTLHIDRPVHS